MLTNQQQTLCNMGNEDDAAATEIEVLRNDLTTALGMLADWCVTVERSEDWDEHYTDASYRDGPLRAMLDKAIDEARARRA